MKELKEKEKKEKKAVTKKISLDEHRERLWSLKNDLAAGKVKNVREIKKIKKEIARILTHMHNA